VGLRLYIPWCSQSEAWRTLKDRIITEDLGFTTAMMKFVVRRWLLEVFKVKSLKPFDEMVLGAVLSRATELYAANERDLHFCDLDGHLASQHPPLVAEYESCGLTVHQDFGVP
jgi:hypothetical protein